jgi:hypothetical protein
VAEEWRGRKLGGESADLPSKSINNIGRRLTYCQYM